MTWDITKVNRCNEDFRQDLERRVNELTAELCGAQADFLRQKRLATLNQLATTVSHELRNLLGVIRGSNFVAHSDLSGEARRIQRAVERIERSALRCDRIIEGSFSISLASRRSNWSQRR